MKNLYLDNTQLTKDKKYTYLTADVSSAATTITVQSIVGFAINKILCIGEIGEEDSEIVKTSSSTAPSGTTVTLSAAITFAHNQDTKVYILDFDQAEISHATSTTGTKTVITTISLQSDQKETIYNDTAYTSGYYFARFKDSINTLYSDYSDLSPYSGFGDNTVWAIKNRALESTGEVIGGVITHRFLDDCLWEGRREFHNSPGKRSFRHVFNYDLGNISTGMYKVAVPTDLEKNYSAENIYGVRIGTEANMKYMDKKEWDDRYQGIAHTTLSANYGTADATITLSNCRDFDSSGSIKISDDSISYSVKNVSSGTLLVSTAGGSSHTAGDDVWSSDVGYGLPQLFTVFVDADGTSYIAFDCPVSASYVNQNIYCDYYKTVTAKDSDADELDEPEYDMYVNYLSYRIKKKKNPKDVNFKDDDYQIWLAKKATALRNEKLGQSINIVPDVDDLPIP